VSLTEGPHDTKAGVPSSQVVRQLAFFESRRQLKSPLLWLAVLTSLVLLWLAVNDEPATLWARSVTIAGSCLPIAVAALLLGNTAALRDHSSRIGETTDAPPTTRDVRMLGLVAGSWLAFLLAIVVVVVGVVLSLQDDPAGSLLIPELVVGPMLVLLGQSLGVALGRWVPNPLAAPLTLVMLIGLFLVKDFWPGPRTIPAASPFLPWRSAYTDWVQGEPRLPLVHLGYLVGLIGLFTATAARRWRTLAVSGVLLLGTAVPLSGIETAGEQVAAAVEEWADEQPRTCEVRGTIEYCAIEGYEPWIDDWVRGIDRVQSLVPVELDTMQIQQTAEGLASYYDQDPAVAHVHGRLAKVGVPLEQVLAPELGMPATGGEAAAMNTDLPACMARVLPVYVSGEARAIAYLVLTELAVPGSIQSGGFGGSIRFGQIEVSEGEAELALQIANGSESEILSVLHPRWAELNDPTTSSAEIAGWFGLPAPQAANGSPYESMQCECTNDGVSCTSRGSP
jgi:hypothetical protein